LPTPGRFLHLKVEIELDLSTVEYVVFDEADRLFEMGFAIQLTEILHGLSSSRQNSPLLCHSTQVIGRLCALLDYRTQSSVRLDADTKVSQDLESAFFHGKECGDKEGALLQIIQDVIKMPATSNAPKSSFGRRGQ